MGGPSKYIHEAGAACYHDVLDIGQGFELGGAGEQRRLPPDAIVLEDVVRLADAFYINVKSSQHYVACLVFLFFLFGTVRGGALTIGMGGPIP